MTTVLITGANRGIGLEFVRQYLAQGAQIIATCRKPEQAFILHGLKTKHSSQITVLPLDVADPKSIERCYEAVREHTQALNILINNAGIPYGSKRFNDSEKFGDLTMDALTKIMRVNALAPLLVVQRFTELLRAGKPAKVVNMSSLFGSIGEHDSLTHAKCYGYSASKVAGNMFTMLLSRELAAEDILTTTIDPGWVQTDMGGKHAPQTVEETVRGMISVINGLSPKNSGQFIHWTGRQVAW